MQVFYLAPIEHGKHLHKDATREKMSLLSRAGGSGHPAALDRPAQRT